MGRGGRPARWPDLEDMIALRTTVVVLAAAHLKHDPSRNGWRNLRSLCQRCHIQHDRPYHLVQRWITYRVRYAVGDLFLAQYQHGLASAMRPGLSASARQRQTRTASLWSVRR